MVALAGACPALAQTTQTQPFSQFISGLPVTSSLTGAEKIFVLQGGVPMTTTTTEIGTAASVPIFASVTGDCTFASPPSIFCSKTGGAPFAASATTDTTNAANISSGTLGLGRLALATAYFYVGNGSSNPAGVAMSGDCTLASTGAITCSTTGGVPFAASATTDATNASNISAGTLGLGRLALPQAQFYVGDTSNNPAAVLMSGDCGLSYTGAVTCTKSAGNTNATLTAADQTVSGGANVAALALASGSATIDCGARPLQYMSAAPTTAWTITAPANDGSCMLLVVNSASGSPAPTFSGFTVGTSVGDAIPVTANYRYIISIARIIGVSTYTIKALQ